MFMLETPRLILVATPLEIVQTRLERDTFVGNIAVRGSNVQVTFPAEWPGDALVLFPALVEQLRSDPQGEPWGGAMILRAENVAIGQMGCKGLPDQAGNVEIGYGVNPSHQGRGYATEMLRALTEWLLQQPEVERVIAECLEDNVGSVRVLEKCGFEQVSRKFTEEGRLLLWARTS